MSFLYKILLLYPYWILKNILKIFFNIYKSIFCFHLDLNKIDQLSGFDFELLIQKALIKNGYQQVKLTKNSGDYGIDILAKRKHVTYGFQCKRYQKKISVKAIQEACAGKDYYNLDQVVVITNSYFTSAAYQLASINDVLLIDRTSLIKLIKKAKLFSSKIPFYTYLYLIIISFLFIKRLPIISVIHLLLLVYILFKSYKLHKENKIIDYPIYDNQ